MQKNQQATSIAAKRAVAKSRKIKELGITPDMSQEDQDALITVLAEAKVTEEKSLEAALKGQEWYVTDLVQFSALTATERMDAEYEAAFTEVATEGEVIDLLESLM